MRVHVGIRTRYANDRIKLAWLSRGVSRAYACACFRRLRAALRERHPRAVHRANYTYDANIAGYSVDLAALADVVGSRTLPCSNGVRSSVGASRESSVCCLLLCWVLPCDLDTDRIAAWWKRMGVFDWEARGWRGLVGSLLVFAVHQCKALSWPAHGRS